MFVLLLILSVYLSLSLHLLRSFKASHLCPSIGLRYSTSFTDTVLSFTPLSWNGHTNHVLQEKFFNRSFSHICINKSLKLLMYYMLHVPSLFHTLAIFFIFDCSQRNHTNFQMAHRIPVAQRNIAVYISWTIYLTELRKCPLILRDALHKKKSTQTSQDLQACYVIES